MISTLIVNANYVVMINAKVNGFDRLIKTSEPMTLTDAGDYAIQAVDYFKFAILERDEWSSVQVEIGDTLGTVQLIEITR